MGTPVERLWNAMGTTVEHLWNACGTLWERYGSVPKNLYYFRNFLERTWNALGTLLERYWNALGTLLMLLLFVIFENMSAEGGRPAIISAAKQKAESEHF